MQTPFKHLGGQESGNVDVGLVHALQNQFDIKSLVDIGCGDGFATKRYEALGLEVTGIDGDWTKLPDADNFILHDFTQGPLDVEAHDLAYSIEFLEHVEEKYTPNFMAVFSKCKYAVVTAALPGQRGHHHVNCQKPNYWKKVFRNWGFEFDEDATVWLKRQSTLQKAKGPNAGRRMKFFDRTGMFFRHV